MRAKFINEYNFERGIDPRVAMGTGFREIDLNDFFQPILEEYREEYGDEISKTGVLKYWKKYKNIIEPLLIGRKIEGEMWKINHSFFHPAKGIVIQSIVNKEIARLFRSRISENLYINVVDTKGERFCLYFHNKYKLYPLEITERMNFERGLDPKQAMGTGMHAWHNGWKIVQYPKGELTGEEHNFLSTQIEWNRKATSPGGVTASVTVTKKLEDILDKLPIIDFKDYFEKNNITGLFAAVWPPDFPKYELFITNIEKYDTETFLINTSGSRYARYITQLV